MRQTYPKSEKLKSRKAIDTIFTKGKSVSKFPVRLSYAIADDQAQPARIGVSVSKKYFKKAVDRNYFKRVLRECYRKNKEALTDGLTKPYAFMLLYQTSERLAYTEIEKRMLQAFSKFRDAEVAPSEINPV